METEDDAGDQLLDRLYGISGEQNRSPSEIDFHLVCNSLHHARPDIRERAIFIGGLRWADRTVLGYFAGVLCLKLEPDQDNCRLMIESLVSDAVNGGFSSKGLADLLHYIIASYPRELLPAKAAYVGIKRLSGEISKRDFAVLSYADVRIE